MTHREEMKIAWALRNARALYGNIDEEQRETWYAAIDYATLHIKDVLQEGNPQFNRERFLAIVVKKDEPCLIPSAPQ